jgi:hypothetical protein
MINTDQTQTQYAASTKPTNNSFKSTVLPRIATEGQALSTHLTERDLQTDEAAPHNTAIRRILILSSHYVRASRRSLPTDVRTKIL